MTEYDEFPEDDPADCPICGSTMNWECCWQCGGEGGWHDCGEDCCPCLRPEINEWCEECGGRGGYQHCPDTGNHAPASGDVVADRRPNEREGSDAHAAKSP